MSKALIVDDAQIMRANIKNILGNLGHTVAGEASSGFVAIEEYRRIKPDFVTMDITMPEENGVKNGVEALKQIIEFDPDAKVIMITSRGEQEQVITAIQAGALNYILKPLTIDKIEKVLDKIFK